MSHRLPAIAGLCCGALTGSFTPFLRPPWDESELAVLDRWRGGDWCPEAPERLRTVLREILGANFEVVPVNAGRAAIQVALTALALPAGSEVVLPSYACAGVIVPVLQAGLSPLLIDVDRDLCIRLGSVEQAMGKRTSALILPHLAGLKAADTEAIIDLAHNRGVAVIEDVAQAWGLRFGGRPAGSAGDVAIISAGAGKPLFCPGGGAVVTRNPDLAARMKRIALPAEPRSQVAERIEGFICRFTSSSRASSSALLGRHLWSHCANLLARLGPAHLVGLKSYAFGVYAMSGVEAALAVAQVAKGECIRAGRHANAARWRASLQQLGFCGLHLPPSVDNVHQKFWVSFAGPSAQREATLLKSALWRSGVEVESLYVPLHLRAPFAQCRRVALPNTNSLWRDVFSVPVRPNLQAADWARIDRALGRVHQAQFGARRQPS